jgi:hypothetical protein
MTGYFGGIDSNIWTESSIKCFRAGRNRLRTPSHESALPDMSPNSTFAFELSETVSQSRPANF